MQVADYVISRLSEWGVSRLYGFPGDGINGFIGALDRRSEDMELVQVRHEELAAFMACAHAKWSGEVGVCLATSGPGAIHLLNGLYDARMDHQPVVAIVGQQARTALGTDYQQEVDLISLYKDVARDYVHMCSTPSQARHLIDRAVRIAKAERTVTCVIFPNDVQELEYDDPPRAHGTTFTGVGYRHPRVLPAEEDLRRAAEVLNQGERVAMLVGAGALGASEEVLAAAETLQCGISKALLGKAAVSDELPFVTGGIGLLGTEPSDELMKGCDTLLLVGTSFPYAEWLPEPGQARCVQIDIKPRMLGLRYPAEVALCGQAQATLRALLPLLEPKKKGGRWRRGIEENVAAWWKLLEDRAMHAADPINPQRVFWELSPLLPERCILTCDSGSAANWWARDLKIRPGMMASLSGNLATMGPGVPYALAAKLAHPDRPVIACVGDGAMQMLGNNCLITIAQLHERWPDSRLVVLVLNNRDLNQVTWEQRVMAGDPKFECSQRVPAFSYANYAESLGLRGIVVEDPEHIADAWKTALSADRPVVLDVHTDPAVPPLPPHITLEQAHHFWQAVIKGDPNRWAMVKRSVKDLASSLKPGH